MAKRKQQNLEIERQVKHRKLVYRIVTLGIAAIIVVGIIIGIWTVQDRRWIMRYDGGRVATADFRIMFDHNWQGEAAARDAALRSLQAIVALRDKAIYHDVDFTPEERAMADAMAEQIRSEWFWPEHGGDLIRYIDNRRLGELFHTTPLIERLTDIYVPEHSIEIDEEEFAEMWENYIEFSIYNHMDLQVQFLTAESEEEMAEIMEMLETMTFEEAYREQVDWLEEDEDVPTLALTGTGPESLLGQLNQMGLMPDDREFLLYMEPGEISHPITVWDFEVTGEPLFIIFYMVSRDDEVDLNEVEAGFRAEIVAERRSDIFFDLVMEWVEEANFVINQRGYNTV